MSTQKNSQIQENHIPVRPILPKREKFTCAVCNRLFYGQFDLSRHQKEVHPLWFNKQLRKSAVDTKEKRGEEHVCDICNKTCSTYSYLLRHKLVLHKISSSLTPQEIFKCHLCSKQYTTNANLIHHFKVIHNIDKKRNNLKCSTCGNAFPTRDGFLDHVRNSHDITINIEKLNFKNRDDFDNWRDETERNALSRFIRNRSYKLLNGNQVINYMCYCNSRCKNKSTGKKDSKFAGTNKIDSFCPANILLKSNSSTNLFPASVEYCSTHLGHKCEVERPPVAKKCKSVPADQLLSVVPVQHASSTNQQLNEDNAKEDLPTDRQSVETQKEKSVILKELQRHTSKKYQVDARKAIYSFLGQLDKFTTKKQCTEIIKTLRELSSLCKSMGQTNKCSVFLKKT